MPDIFQDNRIATGHNNTAGLMNLEAIVVDGEYFVAVDDLGKWREGAPVLYGDGIGGVAGLPSTTWVSGHITLAHYHYLYTTLLGGSLSGRVTIRTRRYDPASYANYNAVLTIRPASDLNKTLGAYPNFIWTFTKLELIP